MAKLILSMDGLVLKEILSTRSAPPSAASRTTTSRSTTWPCRGEHAVIVTILNDSFLEDLGSTNGTLVNGKPIKKHFLQNNDVIELGKYKLKYINDTAGKTTAPQDFNPNVEMDGITRRVPMLA